MDWEESAKKQFGLVTRSDALALKLKEKQLERLVSSGKWKRLYPSVYQRADAPTHWPCPVWAAVLWAGDRAVVSHETAARWLDFKEVPVGPVHLTTTSTLGAHEGVIVHRARSLHPADVTKRRGIRLTDVPRTLLDWGGDLDEDRFEQRVDESLYRPLTTLQQLKWCIQRNKTRGRDGGRLFKVIVKNRLRYGQLESVLESEFERFLRKNDFPPAEHGHEVIWNDCWIGKVDFAWPDKKVCVQTHGFAVHTTEKVWHNDQETQNKLEMAGWHLYVVTKRMLTKHEAAVRQMLRRALGLTPEVALASTETPASSP